MLLSLTIACYVQQHKTGIDAKPMALVHTIILHHHGPQHKDINIKLMCQALTKKLNYLFQCLQYQTH